MSDYKQRTRVAVLQALATLRMVRIEFFTDADGVDIPARLRESPLVALDFGRRAPTPIDDLECTADAISGTLRFGDEWHHCSVPWDAIACFAELGPTPTARAWTPTVIKGGKPS